MKGCWCYQLLSSTFSMGSRYSQHAQKRTSVLCLCSHREISEIAGSIQDTFFVVITWSKTHDSALAKILISVYKRNLKSRLSSTSQLWKSQNKGNGVWVLLSPIRIAFAPIPTFKSCIHISYQWRRSEPDVMKMNRSHELSFSIMSCIQDFFGMKLYM